MKYNPKVNEAMAALPGFADVHPTRDAPSCTHALALAKNHPHPARTGRQTRAIRACGMRAQPNE